jgi:hypothetical protein
MLHDLLLPLYALLIGLSVAVYSRWQARRDRTRRGKAAVFRKVRERFTSEEDMLRWYETEPLSGWGGKTAKNLVDAGMWKFVIEYVDSIDAGNYA